MLESQTLTSKNGQLEQIVKSLTTVNNGYKSIPIEAKDPYGEFSELLDKIAARVFSGQRSSGSEYLDYIKVTDQKRANSSTRQLSQEKEDNLSNINRSQHNQDLTKLKNGSDNASQSQEFQLNSQSLQATDKAHIPEVIKAVNKEIEKRLEQSKDKPLTKQDLREITKSLTELEKILPQEEKQIVSQLLEDITRSIGESIKELKTLPKGFGAIQGDMLLALASRALTEAALGARPELTDRTYDISKVLQKGGSSALGSVDKGSSFLSSGTPILIKQDREFNSDSARFPKVSAKTIPPRTLEKVELALKEALKSKDGKTISVKIDESAFGKIKVDVTLKDGILHARVCAENPEVAYFIRDRAHELQGTLRRVGLNANEVRVSVPHGSQERDAEWGGNQKQSNKEGRESETGQEQKKESEQLKATDLLSVINEYLQ